MESTNNDLVYGSSGRIGEMLVFRQRGKRTFISRRASRSDRPPTVKQEAVRERFKDAVAYGVAVTNDPAKKALYEAKITGIESAYNLALADFFKSPEVKSIATAAYTGQIGDIITIRATDDFGVDKVFVSILDNTGAELESGPAVISANALDWAYTAATLNVVTVGCTIKVSAVDLPGNVTTEEVEL